jgi:hypothetical protein
MAEQDKKVEKPVVEQQVNEQPTVQEEYFKDLLEDDEELNELAKPKLSEEQLRKNKDAEEARKRREAEAKQKKEAETKQTTVETPAPANKPATAEVKPEKPAEPAQDQKAEQVNKLGEQLVQFKQKYPDVDLAQLDSDKGFKRFIDGRIMGKKDFTKLYEEFQEFRQEMGLQSQIQNNQIKSQASTGSSVSTATAGSDVYSEDELKRLSEKLPFMNPKEATKIDAKLKRSIQYYDNKK